LTSNLHSITTLPLLSVSQFSNSVSPDGLQLAYDSTAIRPHCSNPISGQNDLARRSRVDCGHGSASKLYPRHRFGHLALFSLSLRRLIIPFGLGDAIDVVDIYVSLLPTIIGLTGFSAPHAHYHISHTRNEGSSIDEDSVNWWFNTRHVRHQYL
jgi:hypothetical protein